jgi:hypothetical protein
MIMSTVFGCACLSVYIHHTAEIYQWRPSVPTTPWLHTTRHALYPLAPCPLRAPCRSHPLRQVPAHLDPALAHTASRIPSPPRTPHHQYIRCARSGASSRLTPPGSGVSHRLVPAVVLDASARAYLIPPTVSAANVACFPLPTSPFSVSLCTPTPSSHPPSPHIGPTPPIRRRPARRQTRFSPLTLPPSLTRATRPFERAPSLHDAPAQPHPEYHTQRRRRPHRFRRLCSVAHGASEQPARILHPIPKTKTSPVSIFHSPAARPCASVPKCDHQQDALPTVILRERARELGNTVLLETHADVKESWIFSCGPASHAFTCSYIFLSFFLTRLL